MIKTLTVLVCILPFYVNSQDSTYFENLLKKLGNELENNLTESKIKLTHILKDEQVASSAYFRAYCYNFLGEIYLEEAKYDSSIYYLEKALYLRETNNYPARAGSTCELLASVYLELGEYETSLELMNKSLKIKEALGNQDYLKHLYYSMGNIYFLMDKYENAVFYYQKSREIYVATQDTIGIGNCYHALAQVLFFQDFNREAINAYQNAITYYESTGNYEKMGAPLNGLGVVYEYLEIYDTAIFYYDKAYDLLKEQGNYRSMDKILKSKAETYVKLDQPDSAIQMYQNYIAYRDSIFDDAKIGALYEFQAKYETREAEYEKILAEKEMAYIKTQNASQQKTIYILLTSFIILLGSLVFFYRNLRNRARLKALELDLKNKEIDKILKDQEARSYAALLEGQNAERERIAQDLHDRLGGTLAAVKVHFSQMDDRIDALKTENKSFFQKVNGLLNDAVQDVRRISHDLVSKRLAKLGLKAALEDLAEVLRRSRNMSVETVIDENLEGLPKWKEQEIYAVFQEMVSNTLKHAGATQVEMQLNRTETGLNITFEDNGSGYDPNVNTGNGLGLSGMDKRVRRMKGTLNIDTLLGRGTIIMINIPL